MPTLKLSKSYDMDALRHHGVYIHKSMVNASDVKQICHAFDSMIDAGKILPPRYAKLAYDNATFTVNELDDMHAKMNDKSLSVPNDILCQGPQAYRNDVVHVTLKNPLIDLPELFCIFLNEKLLEFASSYLGGLAFLGYIKVKKSFANDLKVRSYNHKYHIDDNAEKILKCIMYLSEVGKNDGGFNYVMKSHSLSLFDEQVLGMPEQVYWSESELLKLFPKEHLIEVYGSAGDMIFADTKGIHKEGNATENDRMVIIANFVLEEEYSGKVVRQKVNEENFANLTSAQQQALQYFDIVPHEQFN